MIPKDENPEKPYRVEDGRLGGDGFVSLESAEQSSYNKHASSGLQMMKRIDFSGNGDYNKALYAVANICSCY
jgi:hypothetical protein